MAREILFKAKQIDNGEWVEGNVILSDDTDDDFEAIIIPKTDSNMFTKHSGLKEISCDLGFEKWHKVDKNTICQFTGLTDKNGNKIWENDIVYIPYERLEDSYCKVVFKRGAFIGEMADTCEDCIVNRRIEVIGNVFDNPELLKGGE